VDLELVVWIAVFVGGYAAVLAYLLRVAMSRPADDRPPEA
jgi:hypothetical protein